MMKRACLSLMALVFLSAVAAAQQRRPKPRPDPKPEPDTVYGSDDRLDLWQVKETRVRALADSTVALFQASGVTLDASGKSASLSVSPYGPGMGLCKEEPFYDQDNGAFCSGSLVGPDLLMTAGHCVTSDDSCKATKFVFGFGITTEGGKTPSSVPASEVYGCKSLVGRLQEGRGADWALVRLDRKVANHKPLTLNRTGAIENGTPMFVIGHPAGLPTKVAGGAKVRDASPNGFFVANLDTFGGNSGSAVFNGKTLLVEGILVRGEQDYAYHGDCRLSNHCPDDGCRGEDVTKISAVFDKIPGPSIWRRIPWPWHHGQDGQMVMPGVAFQQLIDEANASGGGGR